MQNQPTDEILPTENDNRRSELKLRTVPDSEVVSEKETDAVPTLIRCAARFEDVAVIERDKRVHAVQVVAEAVDVWIGAEWAEYLHERPGIGRISNRFSPERLLRIHKAGGELGRRVRLFRCRRFGRGSRCRAMQGRKCESV